MLRKLCALAVVVIVVFAVVAAQAATIVKPTGVTYSSQISGREALQLINGSGLATDLLTGDPLPVVYPTHNTTPTGMWAAETTDSAPFVVFDLGAEYNLTGFHVWNFNQASFTDVGVSEVSVSFSTTSAVAGFGGAELFSGASQLAQGPALNSYVGEDKLFGTEHVARWVRFDVLDNWGNATYPAGLSEVRFFHQPPPPAPEPASLVILGLGSLLVGRIARRRRFARPCVSNIK